MLSVLLSVYAKECPEYLDQALHSIWGSQTQKPDQIVLVQDGPLTEDLNNLIARWASRLGDIFTVVPLPENIGLGAALNEGLKCCKYDLVARMDADDVALPDRFEKQVAFMEQHPDVVASSAVLEEWDESLKVKLGVRGLPSKSSAVMTFAKRRSPLSHPLVIFRRQIVLDVGGYPPLRRAQDYALWSLLLNEGYQLANLPDVLLKMRTGKEMFKRRGLRYFKHEFQLLRYQRKIGFLSNIDFLTNVILRTGLRLSPNFIKQLAYKIAR